MKLIDVEIPSREEYDRLASEYMAALPLEHFMELPAYGVQRRITLDSFGLIARFRPEVQVFNEVLIQYPRLDGQNGQVVPDNMVVLCERKLSLTTSFNSAYEENNPFMILEYVSKGSWNERKDYVVNRNLYEQELEIPYYLLFDPLKQKLMILQLRHGFYEDLLPNSAGRFPVEELDLEIALLDGWVRYWFRGELVPLLEDMAASLEDAELNIELRAIELESVRRQADDEKKKAEVAANLADRERKRADEETNRANTESARAAKLAAKLKALGIDPDD